MVTLPVTKSLYLSSTTVFIVTFAPKVKSVMPPSSRRKLGSILFTVMLILRVFSLKLTSPLYIAVMLCFPAHFGVYVYTSPMLTVTDGVPSSKMNVTLPVAPFFNVPLRFVLFK